jgi:hypothetical protein
MKSKRQSEQNKPQRRRGMRNEEWGMCKSKNLLPPSSFLLPSALLGEHS